MTNERPNHEQFENIFKNQLKIETYSKPIESLFTVRNRSRIDYKPYYQRNYVWDINKASYFIESIILGTEIPPLIFFNSGENTEIIDGRQRFETIKLFMDDEIKLKRRGLYTLKHLDNFSFSTLPEDIRDSFLDSTLRIIQVSIVSETGLTSQMQDMVKKEIFGRYNSGITPLKRSEIDNAYYDADDLSNIFKTNLKGRSLLHSRITDIFFKDSVYAKRDGGVPIDIMMQFVRKNLVLHMIPITTIGSGNENELFDRLYEQVMDTQIDHYYLFDSFCKKVELIAGVSENLSQLDGPPNRLFYECLLWALQVLENEGKEIKQLSSEPVLRALAAYHAEHREDFSDVEYTFYAKVVTRYNSILEFAQKHFNINLHIYRSVSTELTSRRGAMKADNRQEQKNGQLESLRLNKPEPSRNSIEDVIRAMNRRKFLVRPSYQRSEVINLSKASSIIESILLGIPLPAIFVFKRENGVSEIIDGQQRILTILGYIGHEYMNEEGAAVKPKNSQFPLRNPKILTEYAGMKFEALPETAKAKILDFELFIVSIEQILNPAFDPIDLFIRLNDKPYPIKEHSFEMWNSWVDREIISAVKEDVKKCRDWFYVRAADSKNFRDRMENEEIYLALTYLNYQKAYEATGTTLHFYQKEQRLNARVSDKIGITSLLSKTSTHQDVKDKLLAQVKVTRAFVKKVRTLLITEDIESPGLSRHLEEQLDNLLNPLERQNYRRTYQDFYILWRIIAPLNFEMIKKHRHQILLQLQDMMAFAKNIPDTHRDGAGLRKFNEELTAFHNMYALDSRKLTLTEDQIRELIAKQGNLCAISGTPLYWGDEIEIDHKVPLALGGKDTLDNLQAVHKDENRRKGIRQLLLPE